MNFAKPITIVTELENIQKIYLNDKLTTPCNITTSLRMWNSLECHIIQICTRVKSDNPGM